PLLPSARIEQDKNIDFDLRPEAAQRRFTTSSTAAATTAANTTTITLAQAWTPDPRQSACANCIPSLDSSTDESSRVWATRSEILRLRSWLLLLCRTWTLFASQNHTPSCAGASCYQTWAFKVAVHVISVA